MIRIVSLGIAIVVLGAIFTMGVIPPVRTLLLGGVYGPGGAGARAATPAPLQPANAARGETVYLSKCVGCHALEAHMAPEMKGAIVQAKYPRDEMLADLIRNGRPPMPQFGPASLSEQALADLMAYLRTKP